MTKKHIANLRMRAIDTDAVVDTHDMLNVLVSLGRDTVFSSYAYETDIFLAQYADRSYIIGHNVFNPKGDTTFETGLLNEEGWQKMQKVVNNRGVVDVQLN